MEFFSAFSTVSSISGILLKDGAPLISAIAFALYEGILLGIGLLSEQTVLFRSGTFLVTILITLLTVPLLYPLFSAIGRIGGETWKE